MLHMSRAAQALESNLQSFQGYDRGLAHELEIYTEALDSLRARSADELLHGLPVGPSGARPTCEWDVFRAPVLPCELCFQHHEESREWAAETLAGRLTFAVDGSQVQPLPDISVPVAAVQVGWYESRHVAGDTYVKDVRVDVLTPDRVFVERQGVSVFSDQAVSLRRFEMEVEVLCAWMERHSGETPLPLAFFDGSLIVSFADRLEPQIFEFYVRTVLRLIETSERVRVPVVGFVDGSRARDLTTMLSMLGRTSGRPSALTDAVLLAPLMKWGDRTPAWQSSREGALQRYVDGDGVYWGDEVCFMYVRTASQNPPARIELPKWVVTEGHAEDVASVVRAEAVVGNGYPYCIETADAVAVITAEDRRRFYEMFEKFAREHRIELRVGSKIQSKLRRR